MSKKKPSINYSTLNACALALGLCLITSHATRAELQIQEPEVEAGSVEFQFTNGWSRGDSRPKPGQEIEYTKQSHEAEIQIGINKFLMIEIGGELEKERELEFEEAEDDDEPGGIEKSTSSLQFSELELGVQLELLNIQKHGFGLALVAGFTKAQIDKEDDQINWGAIAKLAQGPLSLTTNTYFSDPRTDNPEDDHVNFEYGAQILYQWNETLAFGAEAIGEINNVYNADSTSTQPHRLGPVIYLTWQNAADSQSGNVEEEENTEENEGLEVTLGLGALFGLTDITPDTTVKADLAIEF